MANNGNIFEFVQKHQAEIEANAAKRNFTRFAKYVKPHIEMQPFHQAYYKLLDMFAQGTIKKMMIQAAPQHGKSEGSTRLLPSFLLGKNPDLQVCIGSYSQTMARDFNRDCQKIIDSEKYRAIFPDTTLFGTIPDIKINYLRNADVFDIVNHEGCLRVVGRGGSLTGRTIDIMILDDVYKDYQEANSSVVRELAWKWYTTVVSTRLHNKSQQLIVFTRWHEEDIIGRLEKTEKIIDVKEWKDLENVDDDTWVRINFEAIKTTPPYEIDPRDVGEALWEERHSLKSLLIQRQLDPVQFNCLYQGNPSSAAGRLYQAFKTWSTIDEYGTPIRKGTLIDVADGGDDYLCGLSYVVVRSENTYFDEQSNKWKPIIFALITDIEFTKEGTAITLVTMPNQINRNGSDKVWVESNSGGSQYARSLMPKVKSVVEGYYQNTNKESKIVTNAAMVNQHIVFPLGWETRYPTFYNHITSFLRNFGANTHDDGADALTEVYLKEIANGNDRTYRAMRRGVKRMN